MLTGYVTLALLRMTRYTECELARRRLSQKELLIAELAACGLTDKDVARLLGIASQTVTIVLKHARKKVGARNRTELGWLLGLTAGKQSGRKTQE